MLIARRIAYLVLLFWSLPSGADEGLRARRERIAGMDVRARGELQHKWSRFQTLEAAERQRMRVLHQQLTERADSRRLMGVLEKYHAWLETLTPGERLELSATAPEERVARIVQLKRRQEEQAFQRRLKSPLGRHDVETVFAWIDDYLERHQAEILQRMPPRHRQFVLDSPPGRRRIMLLRALRRADRGPLAKPTAEALNALSQELSPEARRLLERAESSQDKLGTLRRWIQIAVESRGAPRPLNREEIQDFVESLDPEDRAELERLPPERFKRELMRKFFNR